MLVPDTHVLIWAHLGIRIPSMIVIPALSIMPTCAAANTGASLTPLPTVATTRPIWSRRRTNAAFRVDRQDDPRLFTYLKIARAIQPTDPGTPCPARTARPD
jgi:hypothetical protein